MTTFPLTQVATQARIYRSGDVVNLSNVPAFGDTLILGFSEPDQFGDIYVKLARPMAHATCVGTTSPSVALSVEVFEMTIEKLILCGPAIVDGGWPRVLQSVGPEGVAALGS